MSEYRPRPKTSEEKHLTYEEHQWLRARYRSARFSSLIAFLVAHGLDVNSKADQAQGRAILRQRMAREAEEAESVIEEYDYDDNETIVAASSVSNSTRSTRSYSSSSTIRGPFDSGVRGKSDRRHSDFNYRQDYSRGRDRRETGHRSRHAAVGAGLAAAAAAEIGTNMFGHGSRFPTSTLKGGAASRAFDYPLDPHYGWFLEVADDHFRDTLTMTMTTTTMMMMETTTTAMTTTTMMMTMMMMTTMFSISAGLEMTMMIDVWRAGTFSVCTVLFRLGA